MAHAIELFGHPLRATLAEAEEIVFKSDFEDHKCPLCFQADWKTTKEYATHVGRHLEEISLACLPMDQDCDSDVDLQVDTSSNATKNSLPPVRSTTNDDHDLALPALPNLDSVDILEEQNRGQTFSGFIGSQICEVPPNRRRPTTSETIQKMDTGSVLPDQYRHFSQESRAALFNDIGIRTARFKEKPFQCIRCGTKYGTVGALQRHTEDQHYPRVNISCPEPLCNEISRRRDKARDHCMLRHSWKPTNEALELHTKHLSCPPLCIYCSRFVSDWKSFYECFVNHCVISNTRKYGGSSENDDIDDGGGGRFVRPKNHLNIPREKEKVPSTKGHESGGWGDGPSKDYPSMPSAGEKSSSTKAIATVLKESTATTPERPQ